MPAEPAYLGIYLDLFGALRTGLFEDGAIGKTRLVRRDRRSDMGRPQVFRSQQ